MEEDRNLTYTRLGDLGIFKFITIDFIKNKQDSTLPDAYVSLAPSKRQSLALEGELTLIGTRLGGLGGFTYTNKNLLRGGELFELRSEEHTSELQSLMRISYAVFCLKKKK